MTCTWCKCVLCVCTSEYDTAEIELSPTSDRVQTHSTLLATKSCTNLQVLYVSRFPATRYGP
jgi:hypothetical protein